MKISHFVTLPPTVRFDKMLSDKAKLLWGEIAGSADQYGVCTEDNKHFATLLDVDPRHIVRIITQLVENGHILRLDDNGKRKLQVIFKTLQPLEPVKVVEEITFEDIKGLAEKLLSTWENKLGVTITAKESYYPRIKQLSKMFTDDELYTAMLNRVAFIRATGFIDDLSSIDLFLNQEGILKWLKS